MRTARTALLLALGLAAPMLLTGVIVHGSAGARVLQGGVLLLVLAGAAAAWMWRQGARLDREQDERERFIVGRSAGFTVFVAAIALQGLWSWRFATGAGGDDLFWMVVLLWTTFAGSYAYNRLRA
jgi:hypothetical protein